MTCRVRSGNQCCASETYLLSAVKDYDVLSNDRCGDYQEMALNQVTGDTWQRFHCFETVSDGVRAEDGVSQHDILFHL